ncbi:protein phosphatase 2C domain-containing protein [Yoonia sp. SS1-5]|uniref:PP2C family serine/threonine-protein phosphatase n=1 Tax=Yoonia rhodophyticola TaxID=3137370 RepID=A0AAN0MM66_9RHOB
MLDDKTHSASKLKMDAAAAATQGKRSYQEDTIISHFPLGQSYGYAIVADGVGGHAAGAVASAIATSETFNTIKMNEDQVTNPMSAPLVLREAAEAANSRIQTHAKVNQDSFGMSTTLLVPVITGDKLLWLSIGDSPLLLFRAGALRQLNKDHSMAPQIDMMVKVGSMDAETGKNHPDRNALTSALNGDEIAMIDCPSVPVSLLPGDIVVATTDGLQSLSNAAIANTLMQNMHKSSREIAECFLTAIEDKDAEHQDNASFVVIKIALVDDGSTATNADDLPVLAMADAVDEAAEATAAPEPQAAPEAPAAEPVAEKKPETYWYRGRQYTK